MLKFKGALKNENWCLSLQNLHCHDPRNLLRLIGVSQHSQKTRVSGWKLIQFLISLNHS